MSKTRSEANSVSNADASLSDDSDENSVWKAKNVLKETNLTLKIKRELIIIERWKQGRKLVWKLLQNYIVEGCFKSARENRRCDLYIKDSLIKFLNPLQSLLLLGPYIKFSISLDNLCPSTLLGLTTVPVHSKLRHDNALENKRYNKLHAVHEIIGFKQHGCQAGSTTSPCQ